MNGTGRLYVDQTPFYNTLGYFTFWISLSLVKSLTKPLRLM